MPEKYFVLLFKARLEIGVVEHVVLIDTPFTRQIERCHLGPLSELVLAHGMLVVRGKASVFVIGWLP